MFTVAYLNKWNDLYHVMIAVIEGDTHRRIRSRFCLSLAEARQVVGCWQNEFQIDTADVRDNSAVDLDELIGWMGADFDAVESRLAVSVV